MLRRCDETRKAMHRRIVQIRGVQSGLSCLSSLVQMSQEWNVEHWSGIEIAWSFLVESVLCFDAMAFLQKELCNFASLRCQWLRPRGDAHMITACLKLRRVGQVKSTGNHGCADTRYQSYFQVMKVIVHSYNVWAWFSTLNKTVGDLGLRHNSKIWGEASDWLRGRSSQLGGRKTSFASIQTVEGSNSYSELKCLKVRGGLCNLDK